MSKSAPRSGEEAVGEGASHSVAAQLLALVDFFDEAAWPDERIGRVLLTSRVAAQAEEHGLDPRNVPAELAGRWIAAMGAENTDDPSLVALEKAFRLAAQGEFSRAGALFKRYMLDGALHVADSQRASKDRRREIAAKNDGAKGAAARAPRRTLPQDVHRELDELVANGRSEREARSVLRQRYGVTSQGLGKALRKAKPKAP